MNHEPLVTGQRGHGKRNIIDWRRLIDSRSAKLLASERRRRPCAEMAEGTSERGQRTAEG